MTDITAEVFIQFGMKIGKGNQSTPRKPAPMAPCLPHIQYDLTLDQTQVTRRQDCEQRWSCGTAPKCLNP